MHERVFGWVLALIAERGLVRGERIGVDASTMEANAALRAIVRRDTGEGYREMLTRMAQESGIETPTVEDLIRLDRQRTGKRLSNEEWVSRTDPEARIARMKDGTTHLAYKPEHAVDLDTGAVVAAEVHADYEGDTTTITGVPPASLGDPPVVGRPRPGLPHTRVQPEIAEQLLRSLEARDVADRRLERERYDHVNAWDRHQARDALVRQRRAARSRWRERQDQLSFATTSCIYDANPDLLAGWNGRWVGVGCRSAPG